MKKKPYPVQNVIRRNFLSLRLSDDELAKLDARASKINLSRSDYARELINTQRRSVLTLLPDRERQIYARLARIMHLLDLQTFGFDRVNELGKAELSEASELLTELKPLKSLHEELRVDVKSVLSIIQREQE